MRKTAYIFPGQGVQCKGMGKDFYENEPIAQAFIDETTDLLGFSMPQLLFDEEDKLNETEYTQAALVCVSLAIWKVFTKYVREENKEWLLPKECAGLSLGEYCALSAAGAITPQDAVKIVRKRGIYMQEAVPNHKGAMAAVLGMTADVLEEALKQIPLSEGEILEIANYNCPGQLVISGSREAVMKACECLKEYGAKRTMPLSVSGPFHSSMLSGAGEQLENELKQYTLSPLDIPYWANVNGKKIIEQAEIKPLLVKQVSSSVMWEQTVRGMLEDGIDTFIEIGPGKTLSGFIKRVIKDSGFEDIRMYNIGTIEDMQKVLKEEA